MTIDDAQNLVVGISGDSDSVYIFSLDGTFGPMIQFRTFSIFSGYFGAKRRDVREARLCKRIFFQKTMLHFGQGYFLVNDGESIERWIHNGGWAAVPEDFCKRALSCLLTRCSCVASPIGMYWDERFDRRGSRNVPRRIRDRVLSRDGHRCLECKKSRRDGVKLTMDHVIPYSHGGETSVDNLVTLCEACNQRIGNQPHNHFFALAGIHQGWDPSLFAVAPTWEGWRAAVYLTSNIMVSRVARKLLLSNDDGSASLDSEGH